MILLIRIGPSRLLMQTHKPLFFQEATELNSMLVQGDKNDKITLFGVIWFNIHCTNMHVIL